MIAYDQRGHGRSTTGTRQVDADVLADDLAAVVEAAGDSHAVVVGHSMGGIAVQAWWSRHPVQAARVSGGALLANTTWGDIARGTRVLPLLNGRVPAPQWLGRLVLGADGPLPCTPHGIVHLLRRYDVPLDGAHVVVVGRGVTVGRPIGLLLTRRSENATVTLCHTGTRDLAAEVRRADIVIAAAGVAGLITADMVKPGAAVLDVGVSRTEDGLRGDVAPDVAEVAGHLSPNPGGVGPLTRAFLLGNVIDAAERDLARSDEA